ncbi:NAD-dependent protein deacylase [Sediminibacillus massiliensis]|uniref:NAD-dependent protein deacylase n=1 Tax=Sediminibacillus massiliensis TaxID=1926277 RepID=UPI00098871FA|nr:NAD-dependent protein deacylase [Sediminibacillus massiliensis]
MELINKLAKEIAKADSITVLTGAGVSTSSGIPDFRSANGIWTGNHSREYYMSRRYFLEDPVDFWVKYKEIFRLKLLKDYGPNHVHYFLKNLEDSGKKVSIVTQNVDGLHSMAGNHHVIEYHGNLNTATCPVCGSEYNLEYVMENDTPVCEKRGCGDILKPDIVLFGDPIMGHEQAEAAINDSDLLLVLGTSLLVSPFNMLPNYASMALDMPLGIVNREPTPMDALFDYVIHDDLVDTVRKIETQM